MSDFAATRRSLHAVAEHVLAKASYAAIGKIGLRPHTGGFATQEFDGRRLIVQHGALDGRPIHGATLRELGATDLTLPYAANTPLDDTPLVVDAASARGIADFYVGSSRVDLQACKLEYSIVSPK